ncbi:hypothetical protein ABW19_dt0209245 [Dactylella cylindrospora]|nr:hypothetical protein ABW19_dt0209245 [Dactylella cylindrospora]
MQHSIVRMAGLAQGLRPRPILACLCLLLLVVNSMAALILESGVGLKRGGLIKSRQQINITAEFEQTCGLDFVDCLGLWCCEAGSDCILASSSDEKIQCRNRTSTSPTASPSASASSTPESSSSVPTGPIIGGVLGFVVFVAVACIIWFLYNRANRPQAPPIPQAPYPDFPNLIEAKYPPPSETESYSGDNWHPGSYLYHDRNRSQSAASTRGCVSPTSYDPSSPGANSQFKGYKNVAKSISDAEIQNVQELPDSTISHPTELPGDGPFEEKPQPPPPPPPPAPESAPSSPVKRSPSKPPVAFERYFRRSSKGT